jgi:hypothetical protein
VAFAQRPGCALQAEGRGLSAGSGGNERPDEKSIIGRPSCGVVQYLTVVERSARAAVEKKDAQWLVE